MKRLTLHHLALLLHRFMARTLIPNLSDSEPIWGRMYLIPNHLIPNLFDSEPFWFWNYLILNLSETESIWYWTYQIPNPRLVRGWHPHLPSSQWPPTPPGVPVMKLGTKQVNPCPLYPPHPFSSQWPPTPPSVPVMKLGTKQVNPSPRPLQLTMTANPS
jgi:hypothetical protein